MKGGQTRAVLVEGINRLSRSQADIGQLFANSCRAAIKVRIRIASFDGVPEANLVASSGMFLGGSAWRDRGPWVCRSSFLVRQAAVSPSQLTHGSGSERSGGQGRRGTRRPKGFGLDGREHGGTLIAAGVRVLSEVDRLMLVSGVGASSFGTTCEGRQPFDRGHLHHRPGRDAKPASLARAGRRGAQVIFGAPQSNSVPSLQMQ